ncbi:Uncharacterised protein [Mycobacterium tuberculosis]|nr:Uncharacterised protein [Mycobacterium tuberculosis]
MYQDAKACRAALPTARGVRADRRNLPAYCRCGPEIEVSDAILPITDSSVTAAQA